MPFVGYSSNEAKKVKAKYEYTDNSCYTVEQVAVYENDYTVVNYLPFDAFDAYSLTISETPLVFKGKINYDLYCSKLFEFKVLDRAYSLRNYLHKPIKLWPTVDNPKDNKVFYYSTYLRC